MKEKTSEAVIYAKKNLAKFADDNLDKLKKVMGLLAFKKDKLMDMPRYRDLLSEDKWDSLTDMFTQESYRLHSLTTEPLLLDSLYIGVSILKTLFCTDDEFFNENCPTCSKSFRSFGKDLP